MRTGIKTIVVSATSNSISLRTTIPLFVVNQLDLKEGDSVEWVVDKDNETWLGQIRKDSKQG